ncbi:hypothetical protein VPH35_018825 [Triticum aestivum]|uniref:uncharacterized protein isoform X1 n=1 Tax=Triticum aestivum TaxID=4565 RepID=UPI001D026150|nr:uncharacterized protein LOC123184580 isoform X1 [Triticum aestivum]XP_044452614.1 uncharacterized protein LOC123184580 isoform X1 [Triticum aestivum]
MDHFQDGHHVRLRSRVQRTYLHAAADGESVTLSQPRASMNAAWAVHIYDGGDGEGEGDGDGPYLLLHSAAYGRYLSATARPARRGHHGLRVELRDYDQPEVEAIRWRAIGSGFADDVVMLRHVGGSYLRANGKYLPWNSTGVSVDDKASSMMYWIVEPIPLREAGIPAIPGPLPTPLIDLSAIFTRRGAEREIRGVEPIPGEAAMPADHSPNRPIFSAIFSSRGRRIRFVLALEDGYYPEEVDADDWRQFWFRGRSAFSLRGNLAAHIDEDDPNIAMCVRAGRHGRLTPLVVNLPDGGYGGTLEIVVFLAGTPALTEKMVMISVWFSPFCLCLNNL